MEPESSIPCSQGPATGPNPDPDESSPQLPNTFPMKAVNFSLHHRVQTGSQAHPASYPVGARGSFPGGKAAKAWSWPLTCI
jgi:hypothetical protein